MKSKTNFRLAFNSFDYRSGSYKRYIYLRESLSEQACRKISHNEMIRILIADYENGNNDSK